MLPAGDNRAPEAEIVGQPGKQGLNLHNMAQDAANNLSEWFVRNQQNQRSIFGLLQKIQGDWH